LYSDFIGNIIALSPRSIATNNLITREEILDSTLNVVRILEKSPVRGKNVFKWICLHFTPLFLKYEAKCLI
jgi:hypothetical protein